MKDMALKLVLFPLVIMVVYGLSRLFTYLSDILATRRMRAKAGQEEYTPHRFQYPITRDQAMEYLQTPVLDTLIEHYKKQASYRFFLVTGCIKAIVTGIGFCLPCSRTGWILIGLNILILSFPEFMMYRTAVRQARNLSTRSALYSMSDTELLDLTGIVCQTYHEIRCPAEAGRKRCEGFRKWAWQHPIH